MTKFNKENPFQSQILERYILNKEGSSKATYHLSLSLAGSHITYKPGDAIGIWPENEKEVVEEILHLLGGDNHLKIFHPKTSETIHLNTYLSKFANLKRVTPAFLKEICGIIFDDPKERLAFTQTHDILDTLRKHAPTTDDFSKIGTYIAPMLPRFYSIASSQTVHAEALHLLVATFTYEQNGRFHKGIGSDYLCREETTSVPIYLHPTEHFILPEKETPIIMIGPGTGVAPYKAFLEERMALGHQGRNWLFFGECNRATDFYYESFLETVPNLTLSLAFSRDQPEKYYVQHAMKAEQKAFYEWLQEGAVLYICGDAKRMAKDVIAELHHILCTQGALSEEDAKNYVKEMRKTRRLLMDVY